MSTHAPQFEFPVINKMDIRDCLYQYTKQEALAPFTVEVHKVGHPGYFYAAVQLKESLPGYDCSNDQPIDIPTGAYFTITKCQFEPEFSIVTKFIKPPTNLPFDPDTAFKLFLSNHDILFTHGDYKMVWQWQITSDFLPMENKANSSQLYSVGPAANYRVNPSGDYFKLFGHNIWHSPLLTGTGFCHNVVSINDYFSAHFCVDDQPTKLAPGRYATFTECCLGPETSIITFLSPITTPDGTVDSTSAVYKIVWQLKADNQVSLKRNAILPST